MSLRSPFSYSSVSGTPAAFSSVHAVKIPAMGFCRAETHWAGKMGFSMGPSMARELYPKCIQSSGQNVFLCLESGRASWSWSGGKAEGARPWRSTPGQGPEKTEGEDDSVLGTNWFFSCSQDLGSSSAPRWTCRTGLPPPPLTRVSFIILDVKRGPVNKTTGVNQDFLGKSGCPKPPLPTGEMQRAAQPSGDLREDGGGAGARGHQAHEVHVLSGEGAGA